MFIDKTEFRKTLVRYATIIDDDSWDNSQGSFRNTLYKYEKEYYKVSMHNGNVLDITKSK